MSVYNDILRESIQNSIKNAEALGNYPKLKITKFKSTINEYLSIKIPNENNILQFEHYFLVRNKFGYIMIFESKASIYLFDIITNTIAYNIRNYENDSLIRRYSI